LNIRRSRLVLGLLGATLVISHAVGLLLQARANYDGVIAAALGEGAVYLAAVYCVISRKLGQHALAFIVLVAVVLRVGTVVFPPYLSSDVYRYVWDGRVQGAGINPYRYVPADDKLAPLRDKAIYSHINRADYARTIYPPAAQIIYLAVTRISERVTAMKLAMLVFDSATIGLLGFLLRGMEAPPERILIYAWHPLVVWEIAGSGHVDAVAVAFLALALLARQRNMPALTGISIALGALVKLFPLVIAPAAYQRWDWRMPAAAIVTVIALYLPYLSEGRQVLGFLPSYLSEERFTTGSGFFLLNLLSYLDGGLTLPTALYLAMSATILVVLAFFVSFHRWADDSGFLVGSLILGIVFVILVTPHYPWYFIWLLPLLCLIPYWPAIFLTAASFVLYAGLEERSPGRELLVNTLLYVPFFLAMMIQLCVHHWQRSHESK
jgi:alpha-1,6-mannosyltransferase